MRVNDSDLKEEELEACYSLAALSGKICDENAITTPSQPSPLSTKFSTEKGCASSPSPRSDKTNGESDLSKHFITMESMQAVKAQLLNLASKNKDLKASMQEMRQSVVDELFSHLKVRQIAIGQLGRDDLDDEIRKLCVKALKDRKSSIYRKEGELLQLENAFSRHVAIFDFTDRACLELEEKIKVYEEAVIGHGLRLGLSMSDFPQMTMLAKLTGGVGYSNTLTITAAPTARQDPDPPKFPLFGKLPPEMRQLIWQAALPGPRILTPNSKHNKELSLLGVCHESRNVVEGRYSRVLSPPPMFPNTPSPILYADLDIDTIIRDLTYRPHEDRTVGAGITSLFHLGESAFSTQCFHEFTGLWQVKRLAIAFDTLRENGGALFGSIQTCCPALKELTLFPSSQMIGLSNKNTTSHDNYDLKFVDLDSNLIDYIAFRRDIMRDRNLKRKAYRAIAILSTMSNHSQQYSRVFPQYVEHFGQEWNPTIKLRLLARWNAECQGWQTRYLEGDRYSKRFIGEDGRQYRGFVESGMICDADGETLNRYDGMARLFVEA